jgi:hypothetical protein
MRRTLSICRGGLAAAAAVVLLTACGGSEEDTPAAESTSAGTTTSSSSPETSENTAPQADSEFCTQAAAVQERISSSFTGATDQTDLGALFTQISEEVQEIEPPAELSEDWSQFVAGVQEIANISQIDFTDQAAVAQWQQQIGTVQQEYGTAFANVDTYLTTECGITDDEATESAAPTS